MTAACYYALLAKQTCTHGGHKANMHKHTSNTLSYPFMTAAMIISIYAASYNKQTCTQKYTWTQANIRPIIEERISID